MSKYQLGDRVRFDGVIDKYRAGGLTTFRAAPTPGDYCRHCTAIGHRSSPGKAGNAAREHWRREHGGNLRLAHDLCNIRRGAPVDG